MKIWKTIAWAVLAVAPLAAMPMLMPAGANADGGLYPAGTDADANRLVNLPALPPVGAVAPTIAPPTGYVAPAAYTPPAVAPSGYTPPAVAPAGVSPPGSPYLPAPNGYAAPQISPVAAQPVPTTAISSTMGPYAPPGGYVMANTYPLAAAPPEAIAPGATAAPYTVPSFQKFATPTIIRQEVPAAPVEQRLIESTWYTKIDYFHWNERAFGADFVNESGPLFTLGYQRRVENERFRFEFFGSSVDYSGGFFDNNNIFQPLSSRTNYFGFRGEYELLFEPNMMRDVDFFVGLGTRIWNRDLPAAVADNTFIEASQEDWFAVYPYLGIEKRRNPLADLEFYWMARIGCTAVTLEHNTDNTDALYPKPGVTAQLEAGVRGRHSFISAFSEVMYWQQSSVTLDGWFQPASTMVTVGLRTGASF